MRILGILSLIILGLLSIPFIAMQVSDEVSWSIGDFLIMGSILYFLGGTYLFIASRSTDISYKAAFAVGLLGAFLLFWVNAAVGIIGNENQAANYLFGAVFLVGLVGSIASRFSSKGMYFTMIAASVTQALVPISAYLIWPPSVASWSPGVPQVFLLNVFFILLFGFSALLFRRASMRLR